MAGYTVVNLKNEVEDQAPKFGYSPDLEARFATASLDLKKSGVSYQRFAPNSVSRSATSTNRRKSSTCS